MTKEHPQNSLEQIPKLQTIEDISFEEAKEGDPDFDTAIRVINTNGQKSGEELLEAAKKEVVRLNWWLQEYWQGKGMPKEQFSIHADALNCDLFNYGQPLQPEQAEEIRKLLGTISQIPSERLKDVRYIVIDNQDRPNDQNGEDMRGYAFTNEKMIVLYPRALSAEPHRIANTSGLAGTLVHEVGHILQDGAFVEEWKKRFNWKELEESQIVRGLVRTQDNEQPERLVTDYAKFSPAEDICESFSAAVNNPDVLDPERLAFIRERWLRASEQETNISLAKKDTVEPPQAPSQIKYKIKVSSFSIGKVVKRGE